MRGALLRSLFPRGRRGRRTPPARSAVHFPDRQFLDCFDLARIAEGAAGLDAAALNERLLAHFAARIATGWLAPPSRITDLRLDLTALTRAELIARAERALDYDLHPSGIRPKVDDEGRIEWSHNCAESREWLLMLNRHAWWPVLGLAYQATSDERYAAAFSVQLQDWITRCPPIAQKNERHAHWRLMETALRMRVSWLPAFGLFFDSPHFSAGAKLTFLRSVFDHANFLSRFKTNRNHLVRESNGLLAVATWFPEFTAAEAWRAIAIERLDRELAEQINADGSQIELSTGYQWLTIDEFETTFDLLADDGSGFRERLRERIAQMYEFLGFLTRPDGSFPQINDGFVLWTRERLLERARKFDRPALEFIGSLGARGEEPELASRAFSNAGLCVMRSAWDGEANWLLFDAGPYGGPHGHEDKLSIEVAALGNPVVVDPGSYTYRKDDPFRDYFVGSHAHNTVIVDGYGQMRRWQGKHMEPRVTAETALAWHSDAQFDFACGDYAEGYGEFSVRRPKKVQILVNAVHTRAVLFVKPDYWCVVDEFTAEGSHAYRWLFQTAPAVTVEAGEGRLELSNADARLDIIPVGREAPALSVHSGETQPISGWYSPDHFKKVPATTASITKQARGDAVFATILAPRRGPADPVKVTMREPAQPGPSLDFLVHSHSATDAFTIRPGAGLVCVRSDREGREVARFESPPATRPRSV